MTDLPGDHPPPHPELATQSPLIFTVAKGDFLYRHHQKAHNPIYFGKTGMYRFDDPDCPNPGCFGVLYVGTDPECCLLESCGSTTGVPAVSGAYLDGRAIAKMELTQSLRFIDLVSNGGLASIGADGRLMTGSYKVAQQWSAALKKHPCKPDGIRYRSRHAPERTAFAIYERPPTTFNVTSMGSFTAPANEALFKCLLKTYNLALI
jgi:RES domain